LCVTAALGKWYLVTCSAKAYWCAKAQPDHHAHPVGISNTFPPCALLAIMCHALCICRFVWVCVCVQAGVDNVQRVRAVCVVLKQERTMHTGNVRHVCVLKQERIMRPCKQGSSLCTFIQHSSRRSGTWAAKRFSSNKEVSSKPLRNFAETTVCPPASVYMNQRAHELGVIYHKGDMAHTCPRCQWDSGSGLAWPPWDSQGATQLAMHSMLQPWRSFIDSWICLACTASLAVSSLLRLILRALMTVLDHSVVGLEAPEIQIGPPSLAL